MNKPIEQRLHGGRLFVNGAAVVGEGIAVPVFDPSTGEQADEIPGGSLGQFEAAIRAAREAFDSGPWPRMKPEARVAALQRFANAVSARRRQFIEAAILETGAPRSMAEAPGGGFALAQSVMDLLPKRYLEAPGWEYNELGVDAALRAPAKASYRRYEPVGVVAAISPYNFPLVISLWKIMPALATGCTVVLRTSPITPIEGLLLGEAAAEADLPSGVLNVVIERGSEGSTLMASHRDVDLVSFTGSTTVGRLIAAQAAPTLKRLILELGGKSVQLHLEDSFANGVQNAVKTGMTVFLMHAGQACTAQTRMLVPQSRKAAVLEALAAAAPKLQMGAATLPNTQVGPLISSQHREGVHRLVAEGIARGARLVTGGRFATQFERGWYYEPTVLDIDDNANPVAQREAFGPVLTVQGYGNLDEAIAIANDTEYGLGGAIYTANPEAGIPVAERIRTGTVQVNVGCVHPLTPLAPYKQSGLGCERGLPGIRAFQLIKHISAGAL